MVVACREIITGCGWMAWGLGYNDSIRPFLKSQNIAGACHSQARQQQLAMLLPVRAVMIALEEGNAGMCPSILSDTCVHS